jgi:hypothetical protein
VTASLHRSRHAPLNAFGGAGRRLLQVIGAGFTHDGLQTSQLNLDAALFVHSASRAIHIPHASGYALDLRRETPQGEVQSPRNEIVQTLPHPHLFAYNKQLHVWLLKSRSCCLRFTLPFIPASDYID